MQTNKREVWKQVEKGCYGMKVDSKALAISIMTASAL